MTDDLSAEDTSRNVNSVRIRAFGLLLIALFALSATPRAEADTILYGSSGNSNPNGGGRLYQIDVTTQTTTLIGDTGFDRLGGIAFNSNGVLYGVSGGGGSQGTLLTINPANGAATSIGLISDPSVHVDGLRFNSQGVLYGSAFNSTLNAGVLVTIDPSNANILSSLTLVGSGNSFAAGIAFNPTNSLYASRGNAAGHSEDLDLVDQVTGQMTPLGPMEAIISDVAFSLDGTLYGSSAFGDIYSINPVTGTETFLFNTGITNLAGLATVVPEPSSVLLLAIAAAFFVIRRYVRSVLLPHRAWRLGPLLAQGVLIRSESLGSTSPARASDAM